MEKGSKRYSKIKVKKELGNILDILADCDVIRISMEGKIEAQRKINKVYLIIENILKNW